MSSRGCRSWTSCANGSCLTWTTSKLPNSKLQPLVLRLRTVLLLRIFGGDPMLQAHDACGAHTVSELIVIACVGRFKQLIQTSLNTLTTKLNWAAHSTSQPACFSYLPTLFICWLILSPFPYAGWVHRNH